MDDRTVGGAPFFPMSKPFLPPQVVTERTSDFVPLHLLLVPSGLTVELNQPEQVLGRHSSCEVRLPLADVSRRHCRIFFAGSGWVVTDLDSLNGVYVNNQRVGQAKLKNGDLMRIGSFLFEVRVPEAPTIAEPVRSARRAS